MREQIDVTRAWIDEVEHWELFTLMGITILSILGFYALALMVIYPMFGFVSPGVYLTVAMLATVTVSWRLIKRQMSELRSTADPLSARDSAELVDAVDSMCEELGMPTPELYLVEAEELNAFAMGTRWDGVVVIHTALYEQLDDEELEAIVGHELAHLYYCDSLVANVSMQIERIIRLLAWAGAKLFNLVVYAMLGAIYSLTDTRETAASARRRIRLQQRLTWVAVGVAGLFILIPRNALSRYREFVADRTAAELLDDMDPMVDALETLKEETDEEDGNALSPFNAVDTSIRLVYATHPSIDRRAEVLRTDFTEADGSPTPLDEGAVLGKFTKFGLTVAPASILAWFVLAVAYLTLELVGISSLAFVSDPGAIMSVIRFAGALLWVGSVLAFPWSALFADGGNSMHGFVAASCVVVLLFSSALPMGDGLFALSYLTLSGLSAVQLREVVLELH